MAVPVGLQCFASFMRFLQILWHRLPSLNMVSATRDVMCDARGWFGGPRAWEGGAAVAEKVQKKLAWKFRVLRD